MVLMLILGITSYPESAGSDLKPRHLKKRLDRTGWFFCGTCSLKSLSVENVVSLLSSRLSSLVRLISTDPLLVVRLGAKRDSMFRRPCYLEYRAMVLGC